MGQLLSGAVACPANSCLVLALFGNERQEGAEKTGLKCRPTTAQSDDINDSYTIRGVKQILRKVDQAIDSDDDQ